MHVTEGQEKVTSAELIPHADPEGYKMHVEVVAHTTLKAAQSCSISGSKRTQRILESIWRNQFKPGRATSALKGY